MRPWKTLEDSCRGLFRMESVR